MKISKMNQNQKKKLKIPKKKKNYIQTTITKKIQI